MHGYANKFFTNTAFMQLPQLAQHILIISCSGFLNGSSHCKKYWHVGLQTT